MTGTESMSFLKPELLFFVNYNRTQYRNTFHSIILRIVIFTITLVKRITKYRKTRLGLKYSDIFNIWPNISCDCVYSANTFEEKYRGQSKFLNETSIKMFLYFSPDIDIDSEACWVCQKSYHVSKIDIP